MSIRAVSIVLNAPISPPTTKLAAVALADWCNDEGGSLFPSMARIAQKVGISRSQAQRIVHGFVRAGLLSVVANAKGGKPGQTPRYHLHLDRIAALGVTDTEEATDGAHATRRMDAPEGPHGCAQGVAPMTPKPSENHQQPSVEARKHAPRFDANALELPSWLPPALWADWVADRQERRRPISSRAAQQQLQRLAELRADGHDPGVVIANSIANGYHGLFPPREATHRPPKPVLHADQPFTGDYT